MLSTKNVVEFWKVNCQGVNVDRVNRNEKFLFILRKKVSQKIMLTAVNMFIDFVNKKKTDPSQPRTQ